MFVPCVPNFKVRFLLLKFVANSAVTFQKPNIIWYVTTPIRRTVLFVHPTDVTNNRT